MTDIERRALLGDRQAQEECTRQGIVLPRPFCGGHKGGVNGTILAWENTENFAHKRTGKCPLDGIIIYNLADWNRRTAQPIGRCQICKNSPDLKTKTKGMRWCRKFRCEVKPNGFCDNFKPKDGEEDAES